MRLCFGCVERRFLKEGRQIIYSSLAQLERFRCRCLWQMQATRALEETRSKSPKRCEDALRLCFGWVERRFLKEGRQIIYSSLAQLAERMTVNHDVAGSSPAGGATENP